MAESSVKERLGALLRDAQPGETLLLRSVYDRTYPERGPSLTLLDGAKIHPWFSVEFEQLREDGVEVNLMGTTQEIAIERATGRWVETQTSKRPQVDLDRFEIVDAFCLGLIPFENIERIDERGDSEHPGPHLLCRFDEDGRPWRRGYQLGVEGPSPKRLDDKLRDESLLPAPTSSLN